MSGASARITEAEAAFLYRETSSAPLQQINLSGIDGELDAEALKTLLARRLHRLPRSRQRLINVPLGLAQPLWVDAHDFDIDQHVAEVQLAAGAGMGEVFQAAAQVAIAPLNRQRPLWRMVLLRGMPGRTVLVSVAHLALLAHRSMLDWLQGLLDLQQESRHDDIPPPWKPHPAPSDLKLASDAIADNTRGFGERATTLQGFTARHQELLSQATEVLSRFVLQPALLAPWNEMPVNMVRNFDFVVLPMTAVRQARSRLGGTANELLLSTVAEALSRYLARQDQDILRFMCPVIVRREGEQGSVGTILSAMFPSFGVPQLSMVERLGEVRQQLGQMHNSREAQALALLSELAPPLPPMLNPAQQLHDWPTLDFVTFNPMSWLQQFTPRLTPELPDLGWSWSGQKTNLQVAASAETAGFNLMCQTVTGPQTPHYLAGCPVAFHLNFPTLAANLGLGVSIVTYNQSVYLCLSSASPVPVDLSRLGVLLRQCFAELLHGDSPN